MLAAGPAEYMISEGPGEVSNQGWKTFLFCSQKQQAGAKGQGGKLGLIPLFFLLFVFCQVFSLWHGTFKEGQKTTVKAFPESHSETCG